MRRRSRRLLQVLWSDVVILCLLILGALMAAAGLEILYLLILLPVGLVWYRHRSSVRRHPPGHCKKCGYDLTGNESGRCPECGQPL
jgi:hypothetical protein